MAKKKKQLRNFYILSFVIIILILTIVILLKFLPKERKTISLDEAFKLVLEGKYPEKYGFVYNNYAFVNVNNMWYTKYKIGNFEYIIPFRYSPKEVENISINGSLRKRYNSTKVYITFNPEDVNAKYFALAGTELGIKLVQVFKLNLTTACTEKGIFCENIPIVNCSNNKDNLIIHLKKSNETKIIFNDNCITIEGYSDSIVKAVDRLLYKLLGIIKSP